MAERLDATIELNNADALSAINAVADALNNALSGTVQVDTTGVAPEVEGAIDAADSQVTVTGDATELTGDVTGAVDAGDSHVVVTGDAAELTGDVTSAVDAGDSEVEVTADTSQLTTQVAAASAAVSGLGAAGAAAGAQAGAGLGGAATQAGVLGGAVGKIPGGFAAISAAVAGAGVTAFFLDAVNEASSLVEATNKVNQVFRDSADVVFDFGETSAESVGLAESSFLDAAGTLGNLFNALGIARDEAAGMSLEVITLGSDLASFNNLAGGSEEALISLRAGLVGEIEPLRRLGISFNAAQVEAKAMELGLVGANGQASEGAKVQARFALIMEQTGNVQGDFARTSGDLANAQRILSAEYQNAQAELGEALLPSMLEAVRAARDLIEPLSDLGAVVLPLIVKNAEPVISGLGLIAGALETLLGPLGAVKEGADAAGGEGGGGGGGIGGFLANALDVGNILGNPAKQIQFLGDVLGITGDKAEKSGDKAKEGGDKKKEAGEKAGAAASGEQALADAATETEEALASGATAADNYKTVLDGLLGIHLNSVDAQIAYQQSLTKIGEAATEATNKSDIFAIENLDLASALTGATDKAQALAGAIIRETDNVPFATAILGSHRQSIVDLLTAYGFTPPAIDAFLQRIGLTPELVDPATGSLAGLVGQVGTDLPAAAAVGAGGYTAAMQQISNETALALVGAEQAFITTKPRLVTQAADLGQQAFVATGAGFAAIPPEVARTLAQAGVEVLLAAPPVAAAGNTVGAGMTEGFSQGGSPMPQEAGRLTAEAAAAGTRNTGLMADAGRALGRGFINGLNEIDPGPAGRQLAEEAAGGTRNTGGMRDAGLALGQAFANAIREKVGEARAAGQALARAASEGSEQGGSPSVHLFRDTGHAFGDALANGMLARTDVVASAGRQLARHAATLGAGTGIDDFMARLPAPGVGVAATAPAVAAALGGTQRIVSVNFYGPVSDDSSIRRTVISALDEADRELDMAIRRNEE